MSYTSRRVRKDPAAPFSTGERLLLLLLFLFRRRPLPLLQRWSRLLVLARSTGPSSWLLLLLFFRRRLLLLPNFLPLEGVEGVRAGLGRGIPFPREVRTIVG